MTARADTSAPRRGDRLVGTWLLIVCAMIFGMVVGGGHARTIGAGFSIQVWQPVTGFIPPLTQAAWEHLFGLYKQTSQYAVLHPQMTLAGFKSLVWPMFVDRDWGRLMALVFLIPLGVFWWRGRISNRLGLWLLALFGAGAGEATMGWYMVTTSRYPGTLHPPPLWLGPHFLLAMLILAAMFWTALSIRSPEPEPRAEGGHLRPWLTASIALLLLTMTTGALVAGSGALTVYNTFPLMDGHALPPHALKFSPIWLNFIANKATVQFDHRVLATITALVVLIAAIRGLRADLDPKTRDAFLLLAGLVSLQYLLGMSTLVSGMADLGFVHELNAVLLLGAAILCRHRLRGALPATNLAPAGVRRHMEPAE